MVYLETINETQRGQQFAAKIIMKGQQTLVISITSLYYLIPFIFITYRERLHAQPFTGTRRNMDAGRWTVFCFSE